VAQNELGIGLSRKKKLSSFAIENSISKNSKLNLITQKSDG